jgi:hypothetical protein
LYFPYSASFNSSTSVFRASVGDITVIQRQWEPSSGSRNIPGLPGSGGGIAPGVSGVGSSGSAGATLSPAPSSIPDFTLPFVTIVIGTGGAWAFNRATRKLKPRKMRGGIAFPLRGFGFAYTPGGTFVGETQVRLRRGADWFQAATRLRKTLVPTGYAAIFVLGVAFGWPFIVLQSWPPTTPGLQIIEYGLALCYAVVLAVELTRYPQVLWTVTVEGVRSHYDPAFVPWKGGRRSASWEVPAQDVESVGVRPGTLTRGTAGVASHEILLLTKRGDRAVVVLEDLGQAEELANHVASVLGKEVRYASAYSPRPQVGPSRVHW